MPTLPHEVPLELFREDPALILRLVRDSFGFTLPTHEKARTERMIRA